MAKKPIRPAPAAPETPAAGLQRTKVAAAGKTLRVKSAAELSELLSVSRGTVTRWIRDGMPVENPDAPPGKPYLIDVGIAVRWIQEMAANEARDEEGGLGALPADGGETYEDAKTRKERALANAAESDASIKAIAEGEKRGEVSPNSTMLDTVRQENASLATKLSEVGRLVELRFAKAKPERIGREVDDMIRQAMRDNLRCDVQGAMEVFDEPMVEPHVGH